MKCIGEHIAIGSEILLGQILNSHARTVSLEFANHGFFIYHHQAVGDNRQRIAEVLKHAAARSNVVIITGGIGPTADDLTREAVALHLGRTMILDEAALEQVKSFFRHRNREMPLENQKQAMRIEGAEILPNPNGTAPGQYVQAAGVHYFLLPGPPLEMKPMLQAHVIPRLQVIFPSPQVLVSRVLHFCGIGESHVDEQIPDLLKLENPTVAPLAGEGEMLLRITARADSEAEAIGKIGPIEEQLRTQFQPFIYGVDSENLPIAVLNTLNERGETLAVAESCTGGMINAMITDVPGCSAVHVGGVVAYDNAVKQQLLCVRAQTLQEYGAVSEETAREMAEGVRKQLKATYGISTTGIAGPGGATDTKPVGLVYMAVAGPQSTEVFRGVFSGSREQIRIRASKQVLWRLWQSIQQSR